MEHRSLLQEMIDSQYLMCRPDLAECFGHDTLEILRERFCFLDYLGGGASGKVYKVVDRERRNQIVAVRVFRPSNFACTRADCVRLKRQLLPTTELDHPSIVSTLEIMDLGANAYIVEMEFVEGLPLATYMEPPGATFTLAEALPILHGVASGLAHAHSCAMTYLHLKPRNILIANDGTAKIADFGLTSSRRDVHSPVHCTAPECFCAGYTPDHRADIYSLGMLAFAMVAGRPAFDGPTWLHIVVKHLTAPTPRLCDDMSGIPCSFQDFVFQCTAKHPEERFPNMEAAVLELERIQSEHETTTARRVPRAGLLRRPKRGKVPRYMLERAHDVAKLLRCYSKMTED